MSSCEIRPQLDWAKEIQGAVTVCDRNAIILYMNDAAVKIYQKNPADTLVGKSLNDCHNKHSQDILREMLQEEKGRIYTIEKKGVKKLISHMPWRQNGEFMGIVEISIELPGDMAHYVR